MRLGKSIDLLQGALANAQLTDTVLRACLVLNKLCQAGYLLIDHAVWAAKLGLLQGTDAAKLNRIAARLWLASIVAGIVRDLVDIVRIVRVEMRKQRQKDYVPPGTAVVGGGGREPVAVRRIGSCSDMVAVVTRVVAHRPLLIDTVRNVADVFLPTATLGYIPTSDGFQGLMGMISSYMGILAIWDPALKLSP